MLKRTSGLHKLTSIVHRMSMKLDSSSRRASFLTLQIKAETLQRNQSVRHVSNTPYT